MVYNIKEKPFMGAIRSGKFKLLWGNKIKKVEKDYLAEIFYCIMYSWFIKAFLSSRFQVFNSLEEKKTILQFYLLT